MFQDLRMCQDWAVLNAIVDLPIRLKGKLERISSNLLCLSGAQDKDISAVLQMLLNQKEMKVMFLNNGYKQVLLGISNYEL